MEITDRSLRAANAAAAGQEGGVFTHRRKKHHGSLVEEVQNFDFGSSSALIILQQLKVFSFRRVSILSLRCPSGTTSIDQRFRQDPENSGVFSTFAVKVQNSGLFIEERAAESFRYAQNRAADNLWG